VQLVDATHVSDLPESVGNRLTPPQAMQSAPVMVESQEKNRENGAFHQLAFPLWWAHRPSAAGGIPRLRPKHGKPIQGTP
jgi:hypothetical protein